MTKVLLQSYKNEYTNSDITIDDLCRKYDLNRSELKGYTKWEKSKEVQQQLKEAEDIIVLPKSEETNPTPDKLSSNIVVPSDDVDINIVKQDIEIFKKLAVKHAVKFIKDDAQFAEVKEFKDMVAIVDSIEKSYNNSPDKGTNINILIQNLTQKFRDTPDDC